MPKRPKISAHLRRKVAEEAGHRCSYCRSPEQAGIPMVMDHIIPFSLGGTSEIDNLCLCCYRCNEFKGAKQQSTDPLSGFPVDLFNPRTQSWADHFAWSKNNLRTIGLTACGRATVERLHLNSSRQIQARRIWMLVGLHPPLE